MTSSAGARAEADHRVDRNDALIITASSVGTVFEWYDFYLYGSLAASSRRTFFSGLDPNSGFIVALLAFAAGFAVRPFGALVFGRLGDLGTQEHLPRHHVASWACRPSASALLPDAKTPGIGFLSPWLLIGMRLVQGLALGGEYGGAATYVAEHAPPGKRGLYTSWIQTTATFGLFLSLAGGHDRAGPDAARRPSPRPGAGACPSLSRCCCCWSRSGSGCS